ncbi:MAG: helix-turn-helix domain-containing protein, partial [Synergistaceae bacterium]|nr:helix-turn-helix domain-containing protein [Synergistaceae bacterium]
MSYGEIIKSTRKNMSLSQGELAGKVGVSKTTILDWEKEHYA